MRALFMGEEIQKSKLGGGKDLEEFELYLPVQKSSIEMDPTFTTILSMIRAFILSQPNNNHNPNNKTTITVVGLRLSNHWEYHHHPPTPTPTHTNSKLHDRAEIEQNSENKSY